MTETEQRLRRQAEWQRARRDLSWPEKIRQAERLRSTVEALRAHRRWIQEPTASSSKVRPEVPPAR